jgi:L-xylulose reductase
LTLRRLSRREGLFSTFFALLGIGREIVKELVRLGANVIGVSRSAGPLNELKQELNGKSFSALQLDLGDWTKTRETLQGLDVKLDGVVNNAGIAVIKPFSELTEEDYDQVMNVNLKGKK